MRRIILKSYQSPGDIVMITAALRDLHAACPNQFQTDVRTSADALFENNPLITRLSEAEPGVEQIDLHYPLIHQSNERPYHFQHGFIQYLERTLNAAIPATRIGGCIYLSDTEKRSLPPAAKEAGLKSNFWIIVAGGKYDFTAKWWNPRSYQAVVDGLQGRVQFVQCGEEGHWHKRLNGVVDLLGKTSLREFVWLMHHAAGVVCPVTFAMHLAASVETRPGRPKLRPCVVIAGGREPPHWEAYPGHQFLHTVGSLPCCSHGGCWKSRCQQVGDGDRKDSHDRCEAPVQVAPDLQIPECMEMITPADVIARIKWYLKDQDKSSPGRKEQMPVTAIQEKHADGNGAATARQQDKPAAPNGRPKQRMLIKFRHGLGDAVQLTTVLRHLRAKRPNWDVDVAALTGKHSLYHGLAGTVTRLEQHAGTNGYDRVFDLDWPECATCHAEWPSTKAERCLVEEFGITPQRDLCRYEVHVRAEARQRAERWLQQTCRVNPDDEGKYPVVLIHYEGNTSAENKNLPVEIVRDVCEEIISSGRIPIILDWDGRTPLADGKRIFNPHVDAELWGGMGTGDGEVLTALTKSAQLMIGVDSGPLHVAAATSTPTIGVWTKHHPVHYCGLADNVTHLVPANHTSLLRGDKDAGTKFFTSNYQYREYAGGALRQGLLEIVRDSLRDPSGGLVFTRNFWVRANNRDQDLVVVQDIAENDSYEIDKLPMNRPVVVDIGAHVGCFSKRMHTRNPLARIIAVECCPENIPALRKNVAGIATVVQAAATYDKDVALMNAVYPNCVTTGGSIVTSRESVVSNVPARSAREVTPNGTTSGSDQYWADLRPLKTVTLEDILTQHGLDHIDILKLDCEGSEFSILRHTMSLDRIGIIVGEYHGRKRFEQLVKDRFSEWDLRILKDGELGTFWLNNPQRSNPPRQQGTFSVSQCTAANPPREQGALSTPVPPKNAVPPVLVAALRNADTPQYDLLRLEGNEITAEYKHPDGWLRGFARLAGELWTIDSRGTLYRIDVTASRVALTQVSTSPLAREAHDLTVIGNKLATAAPYENAIAIYDPNADQWSAKRPWIRIAPPSSELSPDLGDRHHLNSVIHDGEKWILSMFTADPKPPEQRWRDCRLDQGLIVRWGCDGFDDEPLATGCYVPHSLRLHDGHLWWCDSFRARVCRSDGWSSTHLGGFTRGLRFTNGLCLVGLSKSRVAPNPTLDECAVCVLNPATNEVIAKHQIPDPWFEIYDVFPV